MGDRVEGCPFCNKEELGDTMLFEKDGVMVFLSKTPNGTGHVVIAPEKHYEKLTEIPPEEFVRLMAMIRYVESIFENAGFISFQVVSFQGKEAGGTVIHFHFNVIPLMPGDPTPMPRKKGEARRVITREEIAGFQTLFSGL